VCVQFSGEVGQTSSPSGEDLYILPVLQVSEQLRIRDNVISRNIILDNFTYFQLHHPQVLRCPRVSGRSTL